MPSQIQAQWCLMFGVYLLPPAPAPVPACPGRPQLRSGGTGTAAAAASFALAAGELMGAYPPLGLGS